MHHLAWQGGPVRPHGRGLLRKRRSLIGLCRRAWWGGVPTNECEGGRMSAEEQIVEAPKLKWVPTNECEGFLRLGNYGTIDCLDGAMTTHAKAPKNLDELTSSRYEGGVIYYGDNLRVLGLLPEASADLIYIDPPFFTNNSYRLLGEVKGQPVFDDKWPGGLVDYINWIRA